MEADFKNISGMFRFNTDIIGKAIADVRNEDWFRAPGDDSNHLMWLLGHVVVHRGQVLNAIGVDWNSAWASLFAPGSQRVDDAEYPTVEEMRAAWDEISQKLNTTLREAAADVLTRPAPQGPSASIRSRCSRG